MYMFVFMFSKEIFNQQKLESIISVTGLSDKKDS